MKEVVICKGVTKTYGKGGSEVHALRGVDLFIKSGELFMIVGPSGSGKTTLISVISGILTHDGGECTIFDTDLNHLPNGEKIAFRGKNIGFVFQAFNLIPMLTSKENVSIPLLLNGFPKEKALAMAEKLLIELGLQDKLNSYPPELSGGQQQRVAIARASIHMPQLIVCDEPTSALDHETGQKVMELLKGHIKTSGQSLIVVTHDSRIFPFADRIARMEDGKIVEISP